MRRVIKWRKKPRRYFLDLGGLVPARKFVLGVFLASALVGCQTLEDMSAQAPQNQVSASKSFKVDETTPEPLRLAFEGVQRMKQGDYEEASFAFNQALSLDVTNSGLHFLNGLAYHRRAEKEDAKILDMAEKGYDQAIKFDANNWLARYYLGNLNMNKRKFIDAQKHYAAAALYKDSDPAILYGLAAASYYAQDMESASAALKRLHEVAPKDVRVLRASSIIHAALGNHGMATNSLKQLRNSASTGSQRFRYLSKRVNDWQGFHSRAKIIIAAQLFKKLNVEGHSNQTKTPKAQTDPGAGKAKVFAPRTHEPQSKDRKRHRKFDKHQMAIVDVVIIRTEEDLTTSKGVNLLNGLVLQFGASSLPTGGFQYLNTRTGTRGGNSTQIISGFNTKAVDYSLNIANANAQRNEILARPSLVALDGQESKFFSGQNIVGVVVGSGESGSTHQVDKDIGVSLAVTPVFLDDKRVKLKVLAERTFLATPNTTSITFETRVDTSKTIVVANVAMNFDETLILSGLSEKDTERARDGIPFLQDLPIAQYLFSNATTRDFQKSVLILLTPRKPNYTYRPKNIRQASKDSNGRKVDTLDELRSRFSDWFKPYPNWASIFYHLQDNKLYREFRTGDVAVEKWDRQTTRNDRLEQALDFLFF